MSNNTTNNGFIENGLRADIMRHSMENKNLLNTKGSIYVGTGEQTTITTSQGSYNIPITTSLPCGANNTVLTANSSASTGLEYKKITIDMFDEYSVETDVWPIRASSASTAGQADIAVKGQYASDDRTKGTIEQRLTALENKTLFQISTKNMVYVNVSNKVLGTVSVSGYRQGTFVYLTLTFHFNSATYPNTPTDFYAQVWGTLTAVTNLELGGDSPASAYDFYLPSNYIDYYDNQGNLQKINYVPLKCTITTSGELRVLVYNAPQFSLGSGTKIYNEADKVITISYPVAP